MNRTPEQQWTQLSALYEQADELSEAQLAVLLARLEREGHPLLPQLKSMLEARAQLETNDFLGTLPKLAPSDKRTGADWAAGSKVGPYRLIRALGEGGMAEVWLAERDDGAFKRQVAIKLPYPRPGRESFALRFDRERDILASLRHPNIAGLFDAGVTQDGQAWLALEYVEGEPISSFCDGRRLGVRDRVKLFRQVLLAVQHAHANLVIHRDLKPPNILVTAQGEVRLLDFGIAKLLEAEGGAMPETELTREAGRSLTLRYASPEQIAGQPLTTACDVYSLGVVFYELLCGERPYELKVESPAQLEHAIMEVEPRAPSRRGLREEIARVRGTSVKALRRALAPELDAIALRCLGKKTAARYSSVDAVLADVDRWLAGEAVLARAPGAWYRFGKFATRHRWGVGLSVAAVMALVGVAAVAVVLGLQAREESARATASRDFMLDLFKRADQEKSRGANVTARELLEQGRKDLTTRLAGQPRLQAELLQGIGTIQASMGEYIHAEATFADAARIYAELRMPRETTLARADQADSAMRMGNLKLATASLQQAREVRDRPVDDAGVNARLSEVEGWVANLQGDPQRARGLFRESHSEAMRAFGPHHLKSIYALRGLIDAERQLRNFDGALALMRDLEQAASKTMGMPVSELVEIDLDRALLLHRAGHYAEALTHVSAALPRCASLVGPNAEACKRLLLSKLRALLLLGSPERARQDLVLIESFAQDATSPAVQAEALLEWFKLVSALGPPALRQALLKRVQDLGESDQSVRLNPGLKLRALLTVAEAHLRDGNAADATPLIERVWAKQRRADGSIPKSLLTAVAHSLTGVSLLHDSDAAQALESIRQAQQDFSEALGPQHPATLLFSLNGALALESLGRYADAMTVVTRAESVLRQSLGEDSPTYSRVLRLQERLRSPVPGNGAAKIDFFS